MWLTPGNAHKAYCPFGDGNESRDLHRTVEAHLVLMIRLSIATGDMSWFNEEVEGHLRWMYSRYFRSWSNKEVWCRVEEYWSILDNMANSNHAKDLVPSGWKNPFEAPEEYRSGVYVGQVGIICGKPNSAVYPAHLFRLCTGVPVTRYAIQEDGRSIWKTIRGPEFGLRWCGR